MKKRKAYKPRMVKIPMTKELYDTFGIYLHVALATLQKRPDTDAFDAIAQIMNVVALTIKDDLRFIDEMLYISSGIRMMNDVSNKCTAGLPLKDYELACITLAVNTIDKILPRLDVSKLYLANATIRNIN